MSGEKAPDRVAAGAVDGAGPDLKAGRRGIGQAITQKEGGAQASPEGFVVAARPTDVSHLPGSARFWRGRGVKREHLVTWSTEAGWIALRDRWIPSGTARKFTRDIQVLGPFADRATALREIYALGFGETR